MPRCLPPSWLATTESLSWDKTANPCPTWRKRDYVEKESYNLACALRDLKPEVTLFAKDLRVPFSNNQAESDLRMANSAEDLWIVPGCRWCRMPSQGTLPHLEAAKHGVDAMDVLTTSVRLRTLEDGDTDAHLIAPSLPRSPLHYHPLWPAGADRRSIRVPEWLRSTGAFPSELVCGP
ncbi:MAG: IS66 family transposase [Actinobacteria bacterium]|nr:IS66 family transposase [Actinomycetota bacterium]